MTDDELYSQLAECLRKGYQVIAHTNGSAAIGQFLDQYARAKLVTAAEEGMKPVLIHAQTITEEQLDRAEENLSGRVVLQRPYLLLGRLLSDFDSRSGAGTAHQSAAYCLGAKGA